MRKVKDRPTVFRTARAILGALAAASVGCAATAIDVQERMTKDAAVGKPIVIHVLVALCDNASQGIVPVPKHLGNGQDPKGNLYWGAAYGVKTWLVKSGGWEMVPADLQAPDGVLERILLRKTITRRGRSVLLYLVADGWDGKRIRDAINTFVRMAGGHDTERLIVAERGGPVEIVAGGAAHVLAYVGHDGLMEFDLPPQPDPVANAPAHSAIVLACKSESYFSVPLARAGAHRLLLTTGLMAPEAYTLDAALCSVCSGATPDATLAAAAEAYAKYQKCGVSAARNLFVAGR